MRNLIGLLAISAFFVSFTFSEKTDNTNKVRKTFTNPVLEWSRSMDDQTRKRLRFLLFREK